MVILGADLLLLNGLFRYQLRPLLRKKQRVSLTQIIARVIFLESLPMVCILLQRLQPPLFLKTRKPGNTIGIGSLKLQ